MSACRPSKPLQAALPPEASPYFRDLLPPSELTPTLNIELHFDHVVYRFRRGEAVAEVELRHPSTCAKPEGPLCVAAGRTDGEGGDALRSEALAAVVSALRQSRGTPKWVVLERPPEREYWLSIGEGLFLLLIGGVLLALWRSRQRILSRDAVVPAALVVLALVLRFIAHAGPADIRDVLSDRGHRRAGWDALRHLLYEVLPQQDETIWTVNRIGGAISVALLYVVLRRRFADPIVAVGGAAALAVTPLLARFSASDTPYILLCTAFLGAIAAYDHYAESQAAGALALALGLLAAAMQLRPEGPWLIVPAGLVVLCRPATARTLAWPPRPAVAACALLFVVINVVPTVWALMGHIEGSNLTEHFILIGSIVGSPWIDAEATPRLLMALVVGGAFFATYRYDRSGVVWLLAVLIALPLGTPATGRYGSPWLTDRFGFATPIDDPMLGRHNTVFQQYANARYHLPAMYLACGLAGIGVAELLALLARLMRRRVPGAPLVAIGVLCIAALPGMGFLQRMWTPQREFDLFRTGLSRLDPACRVVTLMDVADAGFVPFQYLAANRLMDAGQFLEHPVHEDCVVYYRSGNCFTLDLVPREAWAAFERHPVCHAIEERYRLEPIIEMPIAALPYRGETYTRDPLPLGFYRLREIPNLPTP